jgi:hypothetical protein
MSLLFMDGFDHYAIAALPLKWTTVAGTWAAITGSSTRFNFGQAMYTATNGGYLRETFPSTDVIIVGCNYQWSAGASQIQIIAFEDSAAAAQFDILRNADGTFTLRRGTTAVLTTTRAILPAIWYNIQIKLYINGSGTAEIVIDGSSWGSFSGDTQQTANANVAAVLFKNTAANNGQTYDDIWICDDAGSMNNDLLGDVRVRTVWPAGAGNYTQWDPSAGSNYQNVDEATFDSDTTYNSTDTVDEIDTFNMSDLGINGTIFGVQIDVVARKDDAGTAKIKGVLRTANPTDNLTTLENTLSTSYSLLREIWELYPDDSAAWEVADVNASEFGYKRTE